MENGIVKLTVGLAVALITALGMLWGAIVLEKRLKDLEDRPVNDSTVVYYQDGLQHEYPIAK